MMLGTTSSFERAGIDSDAFAPQRRLAALRLHVGYAQDTKAGTSPGGAQHVDRL